MNKKKRGQRKLASKKTIGSDISQLNDKRISSASARQPQNLQQGIFSDEHLRSTTRLDN